MSKKFLSLERLQEYDALLKGLIDVKADGDHNHDDMYYTESEIDVKISEINTSIANITSGSVVVPKAEEANHATSADTATSATSAESATKATQDASGNVIDATYETKVDAAAKLDEAKEYADGKDTAIAAAQAAADKAQGDVDGLKTYVGTIPAGATATDIVGYVQEKTAGIASEGAMTELSNRVGIVEGKVGAIEGDYLKGSDKEELQGLITAEADTARAAEKANADAIKVISDDYLKNSDKVELQGNINTVNAAVERLTNGVSADEVDGVNDLIQYVKDHGTEVTGMQEDIAENADAIAGVAERMTTAEGKITAVEGAVATKAEKSYVDEQVQALQGVDTGLDNRLKEVEAVLGGGEGSVSTQINDAKQEAIDSAVGTAAADATEKANKALEDAKTYADAEDAKIESRVEALEAIDHEHENKALLDTYTQTEANLADAVAKKHEHSNFDVLEGITAGKVSAWDVAEQNAKDYAKSYTDGLVAGKADVAHTHTVANITDLTATATELNYMSGVTSGVQGQLNALSGRIDGKSDSGHGHDAATTTTSGFMTAAMVTKLNGIEEGATKTVVDATLDKTSTNAVQNKVVTEHFQTLSAAVLANANSITSHTESISKLQESIDEIEEITSADIQALFAAN